jgi:membrane protease subunit HflK
MPSQQDSGYRSDPWSNGNQPPPDLDKLISDGINRVKKSLPGGGGGSAGNILVILLVFLLGVGVWTSLFTVPSDSVAVVQRFGKYVKEIPPGLHFKFPLGIDKATIVPVKRQLKQEFGFATPGSTDPFQSGGGTKIGRAHV